MSEDIIEVPKNKDMTLTAERPDDTVKIVMVANVALVGVPAAYTASGSVLITLVSATVAICLVIAYLVAGRFLTRSFETHKKP